MLKNSKWVRKNTTMIQTLDRRFLFLVSSIPYFYKCLDYLLVPKQIFVQLLWAKTRQKYIETTGQTHNEKENFG